MFKKRFMKKILSMLLLDKLLMYKVLFFILEKIVEDTDNTLDDKVLKIVRDAIGEHDSSELK